MTSTSAVNVRAGTYEPFPARLDDVHRQAAHGRLVASPTGHVVASTAALPDAPPGPLHRLGLAVVDAGPDSVFGAGRGADRFAVGLIEAHRALLRDGVAEAIRHLGGRSSAGSTLLAKQMVEGQLADVAMALREDEAVPVSQWSADRQSRWRAHRRLVAAGRQLMRLFGASGYLAGSVAVDLYLAEVTGNVYLHPQTEEHDD
jgi:hypothetical protein